MGPLISLLMCDGRTDAIFVMPEVLYFLTASFAGDAVMAVATLFMIKNWGTARYMKRLRACSGWFTTGFIISMVMTLIMAAWGQLPFVTIAYYIFVNKYLIMNPQVPAAPEAGTYGREK